MKAFSIIQLHLIVFNDEYTYRDYVKDIINI